MEKQFNPIESLVMSRPIGADEWGNVQANIIHMFSHMLKYVSLGCQRQSWPELFKLLTGGDPDKTAELLDGMQKMHCIIAEMMRASDPEDLSGKQAIAKDNSVFDTLERLEWRSVPVEARTAYLAMIGLYLFSRIWVLGRQNAAIRFMPEVLFERVAAGAGECFRNFDQGSTSVPQAQTTLANAATLGKSSGLSEEQVIDVVRHAYRTNLEVVPDMDVLSRLGHFSL